MTNALGDSSKRSYNDFVKGPLGLSEAVGSEAARLHFNSYSGTDIRCFLFGLDPNSDKLRQALSSNSLTDEEKDSVRQRLLNKIPIALMGELQTLSVSIASSFGPVRRLGEKEVVEYKGGARTVAGSLIFAVLNRDVFSTYMQGLIPGIGSIGSNPYGSPNYVDEIPEFNILIQGANEFGATASGLLQGVKLTNFGTTFSVDDLFTEATYNYVARHYVPFTDDWKATTFDFLVSDIKANPLSSDALHGGVLLSINGEKYRIVRRLYDWWAALPEHARESLRDQLPQMQNKLKVLSIGS